MQQEEEAKTGNKSGSSSSKPEDGQFNNTYEEDEELIDMDMDELSESENETWSEVKTISGLSCKILIYGCYSC